MRVLVALSVVAVLVCGVVSADQSCAKPLSPEAQALKAKYDAKFQALQEEFAAELAAMNARVEALEQPTPAAKKWYDNVIINGYMQTRFHARDYDTLGNERDDFEMRRLYINLIAPVDKKTTGVVTWAGVGPTFRDGDVLISGGQSLSSETDWANIFVDYKPTPEWTIRVGQSPTWFGLDTCESSSCRMTPERWVASEGIPGVAAGLYFAGPWDRGVYVVNDQRVKSATKTGLRTVLGVVNGQFRNTDQDNDKVVSADVEYYTDWGQFGVSWMDGMFTRVAYPAGGGAPTRTTAPREAIGLNVRVLPNTLVRNMGFQAEWLDGEWMGRNKDGFYVQSSYHFNNHPGTAYVRYEQFDPDTDAPDVAGSPVNEFELLHLGYIYDLTAKDKITCEYSYGEQGSTQDMDDLILQYQRKF